MASAKRKPQSMAQEIITITGELDRAIEERMKLVRFIVPILMRLLFPLLLALSIIKVFVALY
ncbi:MAG: hypothetical protein ACJ70Q_03255 [Nitrososphaera sp.]